MVVKHLLECPEFRAGDNTVLRELLHGAKGAFAFRYSLAHAVLPPACSSTPHRLKTSEAYYILAGTGCMHIDEEISVVHAHDAVYIPPGARQFIENIGKEALVFLCIVDPAWRKEDEEIL